jgi:hypothetical protein
LACGLSRLSSGEYDSRTSNDFEDENRQMEFDTKRFRAERETKGELEMRSKILA